MTADARFEELYSSEFDRIYRAAYLVCMDKGAAEDAAQEAFVRALERWGRLGEEPWVTGWIMKTAMNLAKRSWRGRSDRAPQRGTGPPAREAGEVESSVDLWRAIRALPRRQMEVVVLHYIGDCPLAEVALILGCREGTAKAHLFRARSSLRAVLER